MVFFMGFTATSLVNFGTTFTLTPSYFFGTLIIIKYIFTIILKKRIIKPNKIMCLFILLCILSIIMTVLIHNKNIFIMNQDSQWVNIGFSSSNVTQLLYILFCFVIYYFVKDYLYNNPKQIYLIIKILIYSTIVMCFLGFYQEFSHVNNLPYDEIFRNSLHGNVQATNNFVRVYSVAQEPSMFAYFLAPVLALSIILPRKLLKHKLLFIILVILTGLMSTSTTFIVGFIALIFKVIFDKCISFMKNRKNYNQKISFILPLIIIFIIIISLIIIKINPNIKHSLIDGAINKLQGNNLSGIERTMGFKNHVYVGLQYPFLGVGFGTARSKDLLSTWLCNIGFISTGIFIAYLFKLITKLKYTNKLGYGISNYIFVLFTCAFISVPEPYYLFIWVMFSIGENLLIQKRKGTLEQDDRVHKKFKIVWR